MVIGFDGSRAFAKNRTGTENYSYQLLIHLAKIDSKNQYRVYLRPGVKILDEWPENFEFKTLNFPRFWTQAGLAIQTFKDNLDVLFVPAHTLPLIRKPGLKTVITVHDLGSEYLPSLHQVKQRIYLSLMQKYQLKTATKIIAVSESTKKDLVKRIGINSQKIAVIYEGFDKKLFKPVYNLPPKNYFLFVGTVQPRKNLKGVITAFSKFISKGYTKTNQKTLNTKYLIPNTDFQLAIAGNRGWLSDEIYSLPKKLGIEDRVRFLGYVPDKDLPALYWEAIALIFPSVFEGFGLPILEAQACGCPVITSNISSMPEIANKGAILVDPYDVDDIVAGMEEVNNQETRDKLIKAGFENIKRFSWEKAALETLRVLEGLGY